MSLSLAKVAQILITDGRASQNDGEILTRFVREGASNRGELESAMDLIQSSELADDHKRYALRTIAKYMAETATGLESEIAGLDVPVARRLAEQGIRTTEDLLFVGANASRRYGFANSVGMQEATLRALVKQADLQRADGVTPELATAMLAVGVDSIPELAMRNPDSLARSLATYAASPEGWVSQFRAPSAQDLAQIKAAAQALPRLVEFSRPADDLASMSITQRFELIIEEDQLLNTDYTDFQSGEAYLDARGMSAEVKAAFTENHKYILGEIIDRLSYTDADSVTVEELLADPDIIDQDDVGYYFSVHPEVTEFKGPGGEVVGATFYWSTDDGSEGEYWTLVYDAIAGRFTGQYYTESANGDSELDVWEDEGAPVDIAALKSAGEDLAEAWGDESIMDGVATIQATKAEYGWGSPGSFAKSILTKYFEGDSDHDWDGWVDYGRVFPFTPSALDLAAKSINTTGFMYADESEVGRIRGELADVVGKLGTPEQIAYSTSSGRAKVPDVNGGEPVEVMLHMFLNRDSGAYVAVIARGGSY